MLVLQLGCSCGPRGDSVGPDATAPTDTGPIHTPPISSPELCDDGVDNDLDGWVDGNDRDCPLRGVVSWDAADLISSREPAGVLDVDGDGVMDLVHSESIDGAFLYTATDLQGEPTELELWVDAAPVAHLLLPDVTGDGVGDLFHWGLGGSTTLTAEIHASPLTRFDNADPSLRFGLNGGDLHDLLRLPDLDDDGEAELALGWKGDEEGMVAIFPSTLPLDSTLIDSSTALLRGEGIGQFGDRLDFGDLDGDGVVEL